MANVLGERGFVGRNLKRLLPPDLDLTVNCIGKKDIVWCEHHPTETFYVNAVHAGEIARANPSLVHISSDHAYCEGPQSRTVYARSKRLGDELVLAENAKATVLITGHVYAADCPWLVWLDKELRAGRQVVAFTNRICSPTWIGDVADACKNPRPGLHYVLGRERVTRYELFRAYASAAELDASLIVPGTETNPLLIGDSSHVSDVPTLGVREGFARMLRQREGAL